jgi:hypothetical protein
MDERKCVCVIHYTGIVWDEDDCWDSTIYFFAFFYPSNPNNPR